MKIVFFGTPYYVVPILEALHKAFKEQTGESPIAAVVTQPPKPVGRKQVLEYSAVDTWAHKRNIAKYFRPNDITQKDVKADIGVLASYGELIPQEVINHFQYGILVVHPSLLPELRWSSPIPAAIITGVNPTGVTIIKMDKKWDHGPIVTQFKEDILPTDTTDSLRDRLFARSAEVLVQMIPAYIKGKINIKPQDDDKATYARIIKKDDAFIPLKYIQTAVKGVFLNKDWNVEFIKDFKTNPTPETIEKFIRAMYPWPTAWTVVKIDKQELRLKLIKVHLKSHKLILDEVQLEGKNPVAWEEFVRGYPEAGKQIEN
jgi:methionyl-tRNA formyltransferase